MVQLYLVTGFLGAGKTTFLKKFIPSFAPSRIHIIVNEFGKESIDGPLLKSLEASLKQINNGSIFCSCKIEAFEEALLNAIQDDPDYIIVEASGFSDPTAIRAIINTPIFKSKLNYCGTICLVDAARFGKVYESVRCVKKQLASSDVVLINKSDLVDDAQLSILERLISSQRPDIRIYRTTFSNFKQAWFQNLVRNPSNILAPKYNIPDITHQKFTVSINKQTTLNQLLYFLKLISEDTYRIKGFVTIDNELFLVNCVGSLVQVEPYHENNETQVGHITILSGSGLSIKKSLKTAILNYQGLFEIV